MHFVGIDISRAVLDVSVLPDRYFQVSNTLEGFQALSRQIPKKANICMEATGVYFRPLALYLHREGFPVYVVNPYQIKHFARSRLSRHKTDKVDSRLIGEFLVDNHKRLTQWDATPHNLYLASLIVKFAESLTVQRAGNLNRLHAMSYAHPSLISTLSHVTDAVKDERSRLLKLAKNIVQSDILLSRWFLALQQLPGFGEMLSLRFLAHCKDLRNFPTARHFASYTGLTPSHYQSGKMKRDSRISRFGPSGLRAVLYLAAMSASRTNTPEAAFYKRLVGNGKPKKVALTALANRLGREGWAVCMGC